MICRRSFGIAALVLISCASAARADANDWPQFRGPTGQGLSEAKNVPTKWSAGENVAWKTKIPGEGWSSPVLWGGKLYLTVAVRTPSGPPQLRVLCIDASKGQILWDVEVLRPGAAEARTVHKKNSLASPTPIITPDRLYVHFGHMGTAALDPANGKVIWRQTTIKYRPVHGSGGSPALIDDILIFSCDGDRDPFVVGLDTKTGDVRWRTPRNSESQMPFSFSTPLPIRVANQTQAVIPASGMIAAYEPKSGAEIWRLTFGEGYSVVPRPAFAHGMLVFSTGFDKANLLAMRPEGAAGEAAKSHLAWKITRNAPLTPSPLVVGDELYTVSDNGFATCADLRTAKIHWSQRLGGNYSASPVHAAGNVYFQSEDGVGQVIRAGKKYEAVAENELGERTLASYAVAEGALFIRSANHLWRIGK